MTKARITYRFDQTDSHKTKPVEVTPLKESEYEVYEDDPEHAIESSEREVEQIQREDTSALNQFTSDFGAWSSPYELEIARLEQMIRRTNEENKHTSHRRSDDVDRNDRTREVSPSIQEASYDSETGYYAQSEYGPVVIDEPIYPTIRRRRQTPWIKISAVFAGAVVTGLVFGWFVLSLFSVSPQDEITPVVDTSIESTAEEQGVQTPDPLMLPTTEGAINSPTTSAGEPHSGELIVNLPEITYHILQHGIFSDAERALTALQQLQGKGLSAASERKAYIHVYAGIAMSEEDARVLKQYLDESETESFRKDYVIPAIANIEWNGDQPQLAAEYFTQARSLVSSISRLTVLQLDAEVPAAFEQQTIQSVVDQHRAWSEHSAALSSGLSEEHKTHVAKMDNALNSAVMLLGEYNQNPSFTYLWQAQAAITQYVLLENSLLAQLSNVSFQN